MALPATIAPATPAQTGAPSSLGTELRALKQFIVDVFGLPVDPTQITAAAFSISAAGVVTVNIASSVFKNLVLTQGTITANTPQISGTVTWNNSLVTFVGQLLNVTNTASAAASLLQDLQVGSSSKFKVRKDGSAMPLHFGTNDAGSAPTIAAGAAAGSGPTVSIAGKDLSGTITVTTGTTATTGTLVTVTFNVAFQAAPRVIIVPADADAAAHFARWFSPAIGDTGGPTTTTFTIQIATALSDATQYKFHYFTIEGN